MVDSSSNVEWRHGPDSLAQHRRVIPLPLTSCSPVDHSIARDLPQWRNPVCPMYPVCKFNSGFFLLSVKLWWPNPNSILPSDGFGIASRRFEDQGNHYFFWRTIRISDPALVTSGMRPRLNRGVHCIRFVGRHISSPQSFTRIKCKVRPPPHERIVRSGLAIFARKKVQPCGCISAILASISRCLFHAHVE
jgi:hypothetical protein